MTNSQKRLAFFVSSMHSGGAQRVMLNLAGGVASRGYPVDLVLARAEGPYLAQVPESVRVVDLKAPRVLASLPALVRYLRRVRPETMLSAVTYVNLVALCARRLARVSTRLVVSEHSSDAIAGRVSSTSRRGLALQLSYLYRWASGIVAVSQGVGHNLARSTGIPDERIRVIYNPVVTPELQRQARATPDHPWFEPGCPPVLLAVGRLSQEKDFSTLIRAFARVRQDRPVRLLILGEGRERSWLEALVSRLGLEQEVSLPGFVDNPYAYMARASLFALTSRHEALSTVLIEALYCGLPVVATDCPGGTREILKNGRYGRLVPVGDVPALAGAIETGLDDRGTRPSQESWRPFELDHVVDQYLSFILGS